MPEGLKKYDIIYNTIENTICLFLLPLPNWQDRAPFILDIICDNHEQVEMDQNNLIICFFEE